MSAIQTPVQVYLKTEIRDEDQHETVEMSEPGRFYARGNTEVIKYREHPEDGEPVDTMITIQPEKVSIKRSGGVQMHQTFRREMETENAYHHPYGVFHMQTRTDAIEYRSINEADTGRLFINYQLTLNQDVTQRHRLTLTLEREDLS
ncbi:DUF1934 domain-containing protein [Thalassobacillus sp. CUG 92003]|uniref:DUF1934 domain-containing protein n=1 Tax=Thalassobacillus sp. CUG 92003 TaxID=2736641 RepID=UPI0015E7D886|nr:DUF1934 domain-containing protein [Thalassobacillus sp. CUG 92003]